MNSKNILIPLKLLIQAATLLGYIDILSYDHSVQSDYTDVMSAVIKKMQAFELHEAYSEIAAAKDDNSRFYARAEYFKLKQRHRQTNKRFAQCQSITPFTAKMNNYFNDNIINMSTKSVLIPQDILVKTAQLLDKLDVSSCDNTVQRTYIIILDKFLKKLHRLNLHEAYTNIVVLKDEDERFSARLNYLEMRYKQLSFL